MFLNKAGDTLAADVRAALAAEGSEELKAAMKDWLENIDEGEGSRDAGGYAHCLPEAEKGTDDCLIRFMKQGLRQAFPSGFLAAMAVGLRYWLRRTDHGRRCQCSGI